MPQPGNPQSLNRYAYTLNNPLKYTDPTGHEECAAGDQACWENLYHWQAEWYKSHGYKEVNGNWVLDDPLLYLIAEAAEAYGIPWQILAGVIDAEIKLDTDWRDSVENELLRAFPQLGGFLENPGPGTGNIHFDTAVWASLYIELYYGSDPSVPQLGLHKLSKQEVVWKLVGDDVNIRVAAAYVRLLADARFGSNGALLTTSHADLSAWTLEDAVAVFHGFRYGVPGIAPPNQGIGFEDIKAFQRRDVGLGELIVDIMQGSAKYSSAVPSIGIFRYWMSR